MDFTTNWPGKSYEDDRHPAAWHMLDVAACAELLLPGHIKFSRIDKKFRHAILILVALHDVGKFSKCFRAQINNKEKPPFRHWELSDHLLLGFDQILAEHMGGDRASRFHLYATVAGHHGGPPSRVRQNASRKNRAIGDDGKAAAHAFIEKLLTIFPEASLSGLTDTDSEKLSWLISGLTVQADWIGSNRDWFPYEKPDIKFLDYWQKAQKKAEVALQAAGVAGTRISAERPTTDLIGSSDLRPMQIEAGKTQLPEGPTMMIIEDATGSGKTEAALILAHRMMLAGKGKGIFFALPTMATANAMFERMRPVLKQFFTGKPSLALAHGSSRFHEGFAQIKGRDGAVPGDASCAHWLADNRRLSLLAEIGVGTIDQALMAVLPTRFNTLRIWALTNHILIVDEAHSYDPYMKKELQTLLRFQAMLGGSAILLTATLPQCMRNDFAKFFQLGLNKDNPETLQTTAYPAFSSVAREVESKRIPSAYKRRVQVHRLPDVDATVTCLSNAAQQGAACLWVRNAVDDAIAAVDLLQTEGLKADLIHARFAMCDRLVIEKNMLARFGKNGNDYAGRILVATQVVETSLDIDFDVMVSDLAPIGALIQRAGRLWRHMESRPANKRPVKGPCLHVLSPDPGKVTDAHWLHNVLDQGAFVYAQDEQWRTADVLFREGSILTPDGLRPLIEAVHGNEPTATLPSVLEHAEIKTQGHRYADATQAMHNVLDATSGYMQPRTARVFDDAHYPTRLGEMQVTLLLTRLEAHGLVPWADEPEPAKSEALSEVQISRRRFEKLAEKPDQDTHEVVIFTKKWPEWRRKSHRVAVVAEDGHVTLGLCYNRSRGLETTISGD